SSSSSSSNNSSRFTFLATLILLLFVSSAIILRSLILRRRFRRQIEEAIAAGVLLSPPEGRGSRKKLERPKLWDAFLAPSVDVQWDNITPVAGRACVTRPFPHTRTYGAPEAATSRRSRPLFSMFARSSRRQHPTTSSDTLVPSPPIHHAMQPGSPETRQQDQLAQVCEVQVTLLIAMPNWHRLSDAAGQELSAKGKERSLPEYWDEEEGVPDIVLGVTQVPFRHDEELEGLDSRY
ncbi:hypothetical protein B0H21DRAFT_749314, partial [Amylocystis lapponica]